MLTPPEKRVYVAEGHPSPDLIDLALKASNEGIWEWDIADGEVYYSHSILQFLGVAPGDPLPHLFSQGGEYIHPEDRDAFQSAIDEVVNDHSMDVFAVNCRLWCGDRVGWRWMRIRGVPVRDAGGVVVRMAGSMIDITKRKDAEAKLQSERLLFRQLIDNLPLSIYFKDRDSKFEMVNATMARWFEEADPQEMQGKSDHDYEPAPDADRRVADEQRVMETREPLVGLIEEAQMGDGESRWVMTTKMPWIDIKGGVKGTFGISSDVTEMVLAQRESARLTKALQARNNLIEEEIQLAREIQSALLPKENQVMCIETADGRCVRLTIDYRHLPSFGLAGDFFEVIEIDKGVIGVVVGDVMGHGVRSALVVSMLRGMLERQGNKARSASGFLRAMNEGLGAILRESEVTMFATAAYMVLDLNKMRMAVSLAGHPSPIAGNLNDEDGQVDNMVDSTANVGPALGLINGIQYPRNSVKLTNGWTGLVFTDGIIEVEDNEGNCWDEENLCRSMSSNLDADLGDLLDGVLADARRFSNGRAFDDDVCLVGLRVEELEEMPDHMQGGA
ncbi:SpoIIE family protein phosphatase [Sulfuriroseicoccus oceanibius]|uniref:SpoIIE family protein phosphatase n=1 Tax=Sulfuriroseicoccus oceanibius TaxID=2707525 RepID=A0A6B3LDY4_9BACT|nr:SpoIIE family protein phosphatase [Sulfuriroseicoccus oceanibius]QQL44434.1 SpoIIE family protein phosphatase [Sulfuriroseicoccus oceanibius]